MTKLTPNALAELRGKITNTHNRLTVMRAAQQLSGHITAVEAERDEAVDRAASLQTALDLWRTRAGTMEAERDAKAEWCSCGDGPSIGEPLVSGVCVNCRTMRGEP